MAQDDTVTTPLCPDHHVPMQLRGTQGRPTRFADQRNAEYTQLFRCTVPGCAQSAERPRRRAARPADPLPTERV